MGLDTVEIVIGWEHAFGIQISDPEAMATRNTRMAVELIAKKLGGVGSGFGCLSARAFYKLRQSLNGAGITRRQACLDAKINGLFPGREGRARWAEVGPRMGVPKFPARHYGIGWLVGSSPVRDVANWLVAEHPRSLLAPDEPWSRGHVRAIVRQIVADATGKTKFSDDADFINDLAFD